MKIEFYSSFLFGVAFLGLDAVKGSVGLEVNSVRSSDIVFELVIDFLRVNDRKVVKISFEIDQIFLRKKPNRKILKDE
jgi:hypothetical protein